MTCLIQFRLPVCGKFLFATLLQLLSQIFKTVYFLGCLITFNLFIQPNSLVFDICLIQSNSHFN